MTQAEAERATGRRRTPTLTLPPLLLTRLAHGLLWLLVAAGAGAGITSLVLQANTDPTGAAVQLPADATAAEATAEVFLWAYLGQAGDSREAAVERFLAEPVDLRAATPGSLYVLRTAVMRSDELAPGYWAVTVAADLLAAGDAGYEPAGVRHYTIGVAESPAGLAIMGAPSLVATPPTASDGPRLTVRTIGRAQPGPELEAAERFLQAYLAGEGELDRYTAPSVELAPVSPPPYVTATVQRAGLTRRRDGGALLRLEVAAVDAAGHTHVLGYSLDVAERAGRWEVTALHPAAAVSQGATG